MNQPFGAIVIKVNIILITRSGAAGLRESSSSGLPISQREESILTWIHSFKKLGITGNVDHLHSMQEILLQSQH